ncbi:UNVERIFIED_CONTAM: S10 family peptidase, partial [Bacteroidetes bacterium 56_B9]
NSTELGGVYNSTGTWPILDPIREGEIDTTDLAAFGAWHVFQGFLSALPSFANVTADQPKNFNLWTESYGGHYGPSFFRYFSEQNDKIANG